MRGGRNQLMPFLSVVTRTTGDRITQLARLKESLRFQACQDYEHVILNFGRCGMQAANDRLIEAIPLVHGDYVLILDDDNWLADDRVIRDAFGLIDYCNPPVLAGMIQYEGIENDRTLPEDEYFGHEPVEKHIDTGCLIIRADLWKEHIHNFASPYAGDYGFFKVLWDLCGSEWTWYNRVFVMIDQVHRGNS